MIYLLITVGIYVVIGLLRVGADFAQPIYNQPEYVRRGSALKVLSVILLWPLLIWMDIRFNHLTTGAGKPRGFLWFGLSAMVAMWLHINNWLVQRALKREAKRIARWAAETYPVVKAQNPECSESDALAIMLFDGLSEVPDDIRLELNERCQSIEGLCYTIAMDLGALRGFMTFRCLQFTRYMDEELYLRGFRPQSKETKEHVLAAMDLLVDGWESVVGETRSK